MLKDLLIFAFIAFVVIVISVFVLSILRGNGPGELLFDESLLDLSKAKAFVGKKVEEQLGDKALPIKEKIETALQEEPVKEVKPAALPQTTVIRTEDGLEIRTKKESILKKIELHNIHTRTNPDGSLAICGRIENHSTYPIDYLYVRAKLSKKDAPQNSLFILVRGYTETIAPRGSLDVEVLFTNPPQFDKYDLVVSDFRIDVDGEETDQ